MKQSLNVN